MENLGRNWAGWWRHVLGGHMRRRQGRGPMLCSGACSWHWVWKQNRKAENRPESASGSSGRGIMAAGQCCLDHLGPGGRELDGDNRPCREEQDPSKWLPPFLEGVFWLLCAPTLAVRGEAEPTFQLPSKSHGWSSRSDRDRDVFWRNFCLFNSLNYFESSMHRIWNTWMFSFFLVFLGFLYHSLLTRETENILGQSNMGRYGLYIFENLFWFLSHLYFFSVLHIQQTWEIGMAWIFPLIRR